MLQAQGSRFHVSRFTSRRMAMTGESACDAYLREQDARHLEELKELLRIPSVSALPRHGDDIRRAAEWVAGQVRALGAQEVDLLPTGGHPAVYGRMPAP